MRKLLANGTFAALGLALVVWSTPVHAQTNMLKYEIPFAFAAGEHVLPAGDYRVKVDTQHLLLRIESATSTSAIAVRLLAGGDGRPAATVDNGMLRFQKYGARYILTAVWKPGELDGKGVGVAKSMMESAKNAAPVEVVGSSSDIQ